METSSGAFCHKTLFNQSAGREIAEARPETRPLPARSNDSPVKLASITRLSANAMTLQEFSLCVQARKRDGEIEGATQEQRGMQRRRNREARRIIDVMLFFSFLSASVSSLSFPPTSEEVL